LETRVLDAGVEFIPRKLDTPLRLSSGLITEVTEARTEVTVRVGDAEATGRGSIYLSDIWAWPDPELTHETRDTALRILCNEIAEDLDDLCGGESAHPLELGLRLHHSVCAGSEPPILARAMCASPFDAAIHDATGIALGRSAFDLYDTSQPLPSADPYFEGCAMDAIQAVIQQPVAELDAWWIVGNAGSLDEAVAPWVEKRGYRCFKLKILGRDNQADADRTAEVFRAVLGYGVQDPSLTVDSNEANPDAASVLDYLERLKAADEEAFEALRYLEQPTGRDILEHSQNWTEVTRMKPVMLDEGLTSLDLLDEARSQGWSGLALKTCKGHSFALVAAAWAKENGMSLSLQDLTNPGYSAIHAALFASHIPMINGVELNSPQYTPLANQEWLPRLQGLFEPDKGVHRLSKPKVIGLGSGL
jgi:L-alanine-DL-glutamate epimerase-like enolase superfamily enzyme